MIAIMNTIHALEMTLELRSYGEKNLTFSYSETNIYKPNETIHEKEFYVILPDGKITKEKDQLIYLITKIFKDYVGKVFKIDDFTDIEISNDLSRITFSL